MQMKVKVLFLLGLDVLLLHLSYFLAFLLRFEGQIPVNYYQNYKEIMVVLIAIKVFTFFFFKLYKSLWRYASIEELLNICISVVLSNSVIIATIIFVHSSYLPRSIYLISTLLDLIFIGGVRFTYRALRRYKVKNFVSKNTKLNNVLVVGGGSAGAAVVKELRIHSELNLKVIGIIDDDANKRGQRINGVKILGNRFQIAKIVENYKVDEIIIAMPSAPKNTIREIVDECKSTKTKVKILPGVYELIDEKVTVNQIRAVEIEDLLGRETIHLDNSSLDKYIEGKTVLVTGGGGSIGSELCRQITKYKPKELIILDIYENNAYELQNELNRIYNKPNAYIQLNMKVLIASVRDVERVDQIVSTIKPDIIFHAAAHKHVPLMEDNPCEAVKNNVLGTNNVARAANKHGVGKFVLISTDKAVNPTNVMGATKRMCEMIVQSFDTVSQTEFSIVRFGNVLGSNGSVIPLLKRQIEEGGPVTVTHEEITRYFMTIPEAVRLVLQAATMASGGEIFVLDMGQPVKIMDLAKDLIRLSGFEPGKDIQIEVTGLRPGEKLYEELLLDEEGIQKTVHEKIYIGSPLSVDFDSIQDSINLFKAITKNQDSEAVIDELKRVVETYKSDKEINDLYMYRKNKENRQEEVHKKSSEKVVERKLEEVVV